MPGIPAPPNRPSTRTPSSAPNRTQLGVIFAAVEHGSLWATDLSVILDGRVVVQTADEPASDFARRVGRALTRLREHPSQARGIAVLSLAPGLTTKQIEARCAITTALLRRFQHSEAVVVLACNQSASRDERAHALALAEGLCEGRLGRSVLVRFSNVSDSKPKDGSTLATQGLTQ